MLSVSSCEQKQKYMMIDIKKNIVFVILPSARCLPATKVFLVKNMKYIVDSKESFFPIAL